MKKILLMIATTAMLSSAVSAQVFKVGDTRTNLTIGVGALSPKGNSKATFDQHFTMEWGVANIAEDFTIGAGFAINNTYHNMGVLPIVGTYDYYYLYSWRVRTSYTDTGNKTKQVHREGYGFAEANVHRDDINAQGIVSFHFSPLNKLDVYSIAGIGIGLMNFSVVNIRNERGFAEANEDYESGNRLGSGSYSYYKYSYNDLDHVKWAEYKTTVVPSFSIYVGGTYYLTEHWGVDLQIGLLSANIKVKENGYPSSFGTFAMGASYKF